MVARMYLIELNALSHVNIQHWKLEKLTKCVNFLFSRGTCRSGCPINLENNIRDACIKQTREIWEISLDIITHINYSGYRTKNTYNALIDSLSYNGPSNGNLAALLSQLKVMKL